MRLQTLFSPIPHLTRARPPTRPLPAQILRPFSWTSFDVCVLFYGLVFENVILCAPL